MLNNYNLKKNFKSRWRTSKLFMQEETGKFGILKASGITNLQPTEIVAPELAALIFKDKMWWYEERIYNPENNQKQIPGCSHLHFSISLGDGEEFLPKML